MEPEASKPCSQEFAACPYAEVDESMFLADPF
jgi:hypothetical protein